MSRVANSAIPDDDAPDVRQDIEATLQAIISNWSGTGDPDAAVLVPFMIYVRSDETPAGLYMWNPGDTAGIKIGEISASTIKIFSEGAGVPALAAANTFEDDLAVETDGVAANLEVGSNLSAGLSASFTMFGYNAAAEKTGLFRVQASWDSAVNGAEEAATAVQHMTAGAFASFMTLDGIAVTFPGAVNAATLSQGGTPVATLINDEVKQLREDSTWSGASKSTDGVAAGEVITYTGSGATTLTIRKRARGEFIGVDNAGTGTITMVSDSSPNAVTPIGGLTLAGDGFSIIRWRDTNADGQKAKITGDNV